MNYKYCSGNRQCAVRFTDRSFGRLFGQEFWWINRYGGAYIFNRNFGGPNNWGQVKKVIGNDSTSGDTFGSASAVYHDTL